MASEQKITVKFMVDKEKSRVVFAEADNDFVDILFSFLTLPLGTVVRLLNKQSQTGCLDKLYESVEQLDVHNFQTEACKTMLLSPQSAAAIRCEDLRVNIDDTKPRPRQVYACRKPECCAKETCLTSSVPNARCPHCKEIMDSVKIWAKSNADADKLFVKKGIKFMISDDLHIVPASAVPTLSLLSNMSIKDVNVLEERSMDLGRDEILTLLRRSLNSNAPLMNLCFHEVSGTSDASSNVKREGMTRVKTEDNLEMESKRITIKLFVNKINNKVSFVEAGDEFVNLLFSFLTLPLGSVIKLLNQNSAMGCIDNLYLSIESLSLDCFKSEECKTMLLSPKLGAFFGCSGNILMTDETTPLEGCSIRGCRTCNWKNDSRACKTEYCPHGIMYSVEKVLNPKSSGGGTEKGGGYARKDRTFLVTNELHVSPVSSVSAIQLMRAQELSPSNVVVKEGSIGRAQVLNLLRAALISKTPIVDVSLS